MADQEGFSTKKNPLFDGTKYSFRSIRMETYIMALCFDIWKSIIVGYTSPKTPPTDTTEKKASENDAKAMNVIFCELSESKFVKVMHCKSSK
jgi:hypothetical protein